MSTYTVRPLSDRTAFTGSHEPSRFTVLYSDVIELLERELYYLDGKDVVLEVDVNEQHIRLDGMLRADARAKSPGVRLAFESNVGPLVYATDAFIRGASSAFVGTGENRRRRTTMSEDWQHNLYAIAKSLEALRMVDRYGVTTRGEQYTGFKAIGGGTPLPGPTPTMSSSAAAELLRSYAPPAVALEVAWRRAVRATHPDADTGSREAFDRVQEAARVLGMGR